MNGTAEVPTDTKESGLNPSLFSPKGTPALSHPGGCYTSSAYGVLLSALCTHYCSSCISSIPPPHTHTSDTGSTSCVPTGAQSPLKESWGRRHEASASQLLAGTFSSVFSTGRSYSRAPPDCRAEKCARHLDRGQRQRRTHFSHHGLASQEDRSSL